MIKALEAGISKSSWLTTAF